MPSWLSASGSALGSADEGVLRRFLEASRRAEIVTLVNSARSAPEVARVVVEELGEAMDAEIAFLVTVDAGRFAPAVLAHTGLTEGQVAGLGRDERFAASLEQHRAQVHDGVDLLAVGARRLVLSPWTAMDGRRIVVGVARLYDEGFEPSEVALLEAVTESVGHALERAWLSAERDRHAARQTSLVRAANALNASLVTEEVHATVCKEICGALAADLVAVCFADEAGGLLAVAGCGLPDEVLGRSQAPDGPVAAVVREGVPVVLQPGDAVIELGIPDVSGVRAGAVVPIRRRGEVDGALLIGFRADRLIADADLELLVGFAELAGIAYRNADEHGAVLRAAMRDSLTGCLNHGTFLNRLREEIGRADRSGGALTLVSMDVDDFKSVNDRFGHPTGDELLRTLADALRDEVRNYDQVGRLGGDEFMLLLPAGEPATAQRALDHVLSVMSRLKLPGGAAVTISAGVAQWRAGEDVGGLVERADRALLEAKAARSDPPARSSPLGSPPEQGMELEPVHHRDERAQLRRLVTAGTLGTRLAWMLDEPAIVESAIADLHTQLGYERCLIVCCRPDGEFEVLASARPEPHPAEDRRASPPDNRLEPADAARCAVKEGRPVLLDHVTRDSVSEREGLTIRSELAVPVFLGSEPWGAMVLQSSVAGTFSPADAQVLRRVAEHMGAALRTAGLHRHLEDTYLRTAASLAAALEAKDTYTADHARSIAVQAVVLGRALDLDEEAIGDLRYGALLHDIGKIAIPDAILNKRSALDDEEMRVVREHPLVGERILAPIAFRSGIRSIVRHDHERWDGMGYPDGLRGEDIPLGARIVFVVDAFDAMTSDRPYRKAMSQEHARRELERHAGSQFDPGVVRALLASLDATAEVESEV